MLNFKLKTTLINKNIIMSEKQNLQEEKEALHIGVVIPRFFVDIRSGCGAVRDRLHPDFDADYQGLHNDTIDVVEYRHGFQNSETKSWDMKIEDLIFLNERCAFLNGV